MDTSILLSLIVAIVGFLLTLAGVIWYEINRRNNTPISIWAYILMLGGTVVVVVGFLLITGFFVEKNT